MDHGTETGLMTWTARDCPYRIEYSARVLDEIRLAVVDAFFSLPRGGAEIGGILLGEYRDNHIVINGSEALDCEHAMGPSFNLSPRDQSHLAEMTARAKRNGPNLQPVGWYHSHTRSEIFLSDADQDLHNRYFPEPWQIALVLKPHTFEPTRGGFFFREADGSIRPGASYQEFQLEPLPLKPAGASNGTPGKSRREFREEQQSNSAPATAPAAPAEESPTPAPDGGKRRVPITREVVIDPPVSSAAPETSNLELRVPDWGSATKEPPWRAMKAAAILAIGLALGGAGYQTRDYWLPTVLAKARAVLPKEPDSTLALTLSDDNGQMKIGWDRYSPTVRNALEATLEISDGNTTPQSVRLDGTHLGIGAFTYVREHERVDVTLFVTEQGGKIVKEQGSFLGKLPSQRVGPQAPPSAGAETDRVDKLQQDSNFQASKIRKLEKDLKAAQDQLQNQQKDKQDAPDPTKKN